jgi:hypothetical protein
VKRSVRTVCFATVATGLVAAALALPGAAMASVVPAAPLGVSVVPIGSSGDDSAYDFALMSWSSSVSDVTRYTVHDHDNTSGADDNYESVVDPSLSGTYLNGQQGHSITYWVTATSAQGESAASDLTTITWPTFLDLIPSVGVASVGAETANFQSWAAPEFVNGQMVPTTPASYNVTTIDETDEYAAYLALPASIPNSSDPVSVMHNGLLQRLEQTTLNAGTVIGTRTVPNSGTFALPLIYTGSPYGIKIAAVYADGSVSANSLIRLVSPLPQAVSAPTCGEDGCVTTPPFPVDGSGGGYVVTATDSAVAPPAATATSVRSSATATTIFTKAVYGRTSPIRINGMVSGHSYRLSLTKVNVQGLSVSTTSLGISKASSGPVVTKPVVKTIKPGTPKITKIFVNAKKRTAAVTFTPSKAAANARATSYKVIVTDTTRGYARYSRVITLTKGSLTITGLRRGDQYEFSVLARNSAGSSEASAKSKQYRA